MKKQQAYKITCINGIYNEESISMYYLLVEHTRQDKQGRQGDYQNMENYKNQKAGAQKYVHVQSGIFAIGKFCKNVCVQLEN